MVKNVFMKKPGLFLVDPNKSPALVFSLMGSASRGKKINDVSRLPRNFVVVRFSDLETRRWIFVYPGVAFIDPCLTSMFQPFRL